MYEQVRAPKLVSPLAKHAGNAQYVVAPPADALLGKAVEIKFEIAGELFGMDDQVAIGPRGDGYIRREAKGGRHDEAVVVVGVFADQIDASGGTKDSGASTEELLEMLSEFACLYRHLHARMPMHKGSCGSNTSSASAFTKAEPLMLG